MPCWSRGPLAAFGTVSTGPDPERDRIVSSAVVVQHAPGAAPESHCWLSAAGVPRPGAAASGIGPPRDEPPRHGRPPGLVVEETARTLAAQAAAGRPLVVMNAPFGLTLLDRELRRHRSASLADYLGGRSLCVLDPRVLDAHLDRSPDGRRTLAELCARYEVLRTGPQDADMAAEAGRGGGAEAETRTNGAADAGTGAGTGTGADAGADAEDVAGAMAVAAAVAVADAVAALAVVRALGPRFAARREPLSAAELHARQAVWHAARARGLRSWFAAGGCAEPVDPAWPLRPRLPAAA